MNLSVSSLFEYTPLQQRGRVLVYALDVTFDGPGKSAYTRWADLLKMLNQFPSFGANDGKSCAGDEKVKTAAGSEELPERIAFVALTNASSRAASLSARI
jgi:hypothetical protein